MKKIMCFSIDLPEVVAVSSLLKWQMISHEIIKDAEFCLSAGKGHPVVVLCDKENKIEAIGFWDICAFIKNGFILC